MLICLPPVASRVLERFKTQLHTKRGPKSRAGSVWIPYRKKHWECHLWSGIYYGNQPKAFSAYNRLWYWEILRASLMLAVHEELETRECAPASMGLPIAILESAGCLGRQLRDGREKRWALPSGIHAIAELVKFCLAVQYIGTNYSGCLCGQHSPHWGPDWGRNWTPCLKYHAQYKLIVQQSKT